MSDQYFSQDIARGIAAGRDHEVRESALRRELKLDRAEARRERRRLRGF